MNQLIKYKSDTLTQLSVLCGTSVKSTKSEKCHQLISNLNFYLRLPPSINIIGIDIGIKNFSYCKLSLYDINQFNPSIPLPTDVNHWKTIDLLHAFPIDGPEFLSFNKYHQFELNDLIKSKYYISYLNTKVLDLLVPKSGSTLNVWLIESQRIKSNNNKITLPNILTNYLFESLFYSNLLGDENHLLVPMNSNKMANFMINRFVYKNDRISSSNSKKLRLKLLLHMVNKGLIDLPNLTSLVKGEVTTRHMLQWYNTNNSLAPIKKLDDFFDSYLYDLSFIYNYCNNLYLHHWLRTDGDIYELVDLLNQNQLLPIEEFFASQDIKLNQETATSVTRGSGSRLPDLSSIDRTVWEL